jgi:4-hydroxy 2-oxovalerate aldolase
MKILDCTIRDGGYYTKWDFEKNLIEEYASSMEELPIDYIEVGYRSIPLEGYLGKYYYCPIFVLKELKKLMPSKKLVIILNEKDIRAEHVKELLLPIKPFVSLIRMAVDPKNFERAIDLAKAVKSLGFEVAFNVMYMSNWKNDPSFLNLLEGLDDTLDYFYMVDSFGGILPNEVKQIIHLVKSKTNVPLGFHGHDNLHMGLINTITAIEEGCEVVDATITGMGRGAGNLKTELLLTYLESQGKIELNFNKLGGVVSSFEELKKNYDWGSSLPYMFSGAHSLPQKEVMDWVSKRAYSLNSIIQALNNRKEKVSDNIKMPEFSEEQPIRKAIIIGGGDSAKIHAEAILEYIKLNTNDICIIHSSSKNANYYNRVPIKQFFCLVGNEGYRLNKVFEGELSKKVYKCVLPAFPREMGTYIPEDLKAKTFELRKMDFTDKYLDSHFALALQTSIQIGAKEVYLAGFDGYSENVSEKEFELANENNDLIKKFKETHFDLLSLTDTKYKVKIQTIYKFI